MGDATEALEQELAALKEQLLEWKGRYETIHEERLALERKLNDEVRSSLPNTIHSFNFTFCDCLQQSFFI
jgi:molecular chaperone GrpE (heat shock protein)